ncbi:His/Glu/Gln/Arg/opine family amino acid ABC transporter permease subunit [Achromobacter deleyi]|uniref:ABC transporter permease subunit n=1 Tax=Achromobacter deleyi TaxID=1353891 RepID=UPI002856B55D|nr:ABC transporter permease subunit [Achromobacter deleyi]MDR6599378.1 His/Glu/Gln/Arg/opine family amino acid ABC transporter permease subunit [Achromobacter deleyi]
MMTVTPPPFPSPGSLGRWLPSLAWILALGGMASVLLGHIESVQAMRGIQGGFGFLLQPAGFRISESLFAVAPEDPYWMSIAAGLVNTLTVAAVAIPLATALGIALGIMRLSPHALAARCAAAIIAPLRNTPVLLQLFLWYGLLLRLPDVRQAWSPLPSVLLSNRGLALPAVQGALPYAALALLAVTLGWQAKRRWGNGAAIATLVIAAFAAHWLPAMRIDLPIKRGLGLQGGWQPSIEFAALLIGLVVFHAAYIADIVRASVRAVPVGLVEAGQAMGLTPWAVLRKVITPYATRVALPPYANQCLALVKNSTLAIAIGYQELMAVINTAITQTGLALEGIALAVAVYLALALALGGGLSAWNARNTRHGPGDAHGARLGDRPLWRAAGRDAHPWRRKAVSVALTVLLAAVAWALLDWAVLRAVWRGDPAACADAAGACWAAVDENLPLLFFGTMTPADRYPGAVACVALLGGIALALGGQRVPARARAAALAALLLIVVGALTGWPWGGALIGPQRWGGLLVTLILAIAALAAAVPLAFALALIRRSGSRAGALAAACLIEAVRGIPLVTQLLFASFVLPMLLGGGMSKFNMALAALTLHTACLLAEVLRGALQAIPPGQMMAARALGMRPATAYATVIWPQARRIAAPAALGVFVGAVKDTSLVSIIGVFDVLGAAKAVVAGTDWRPYHVEVYLAVALLYFAASLALSRVARRMEISPRATPAACGLKSDQRHSGTPLPPP